MAETLDLDALLLEGHFGNIFDWIASQSADPRTIVDLGAGTGTGTFGLARTYPGASIVAVDQSESMLELLAEKAQDRALGGRVSTIHADLDQQWPELGGVDLMWAATSMHHFANPLEVFAHIRDSLSPDGILVVVEMEAFPRYLPADLGFGNPGFEERCHRATEPEDFNPHPDWTRELEASGYAAVLHRSFDYCESSDQELLARAARLSLSRLREHLPDGFPAQDLATLEELLDPDSSRSVGHRTDLVMRGSHNVWVARVR